MPQKAWKQSLHTPRKTDYKRRWWFSLVKPFGQSVRNEKLTFGSKNLELTPLWFEHVCKIKKKNDNMATGKISSQIVSCDKCNMGNTLICVLIAVVTTLNWINYWLFQNWLSFLQHEAHLPANYGSFLWVEFPPFNCIPRSLFALFTYF